MRGLGFLSLQLSAISAVVSGQVIKWMSFGVLAGGSDLAKAIMHLRTTRSLMPREKAQMAQETLSIFIVMVSLSRIVGFDVFLL